MASDLLKQLKETNFSELEASDIGIWPPAVRILVFILLFALLLVAGYYLHAKELNAQHERLIKKEGELRHEFEERAFEAANLKAYSEQLVAIEKSFGALLAQLPKDTEVPGMLEDITEIGYGSSLDIKSITLLPEVSSEYYVELPIKITATGGYHDIGSFISGIAGLPRIVTLHNYSIQPSEGSRLQSFEVTAKTYRYKAGEEGE